MRLETLLPAPSLIQLDYLVASNVRIILVARVRQPQAPCPSCGRSVACVQSRYSRTLADRPSLVTEGIYRPGVNVRGGL
jgi:hypothetical protein